MNKCKKALTLFLSAAATIGLSSCDIWVTSKENTLLSYTTSDGETRVDYTTNELLLDYLTNNSASTSDLYDIVYEAMLKKYYSDESRATELREIERTTDQEIQDFKDQAEDNADTNQTSYSDEWDAILDAQLSDLREDRRDEDALRNKVLVDNMKEAIGDDFYDEFRDWQVAENDAVQSRYNIFWGENGYLTNRLPYHVSHILVNVDATNGTLIDGEISSDDATEIYNVLDPLAHGDSSFGTVAEDHSGDSADNFGNLGIMDVATSYVNEFKLGIYVYDTLFNTDSDVATNAASDPFNMGEYTDYFESLGVGFIPYEAVTQLYSYRNTTLNNQGLEVNEGNAAYYPRNIIFNTYFNSHNISFITKEAWSYSEATDLVANATTGNDGNEIYSDLNSNGLWTNGSALNDDTLEGFKEVTLNVYDSNGTKTTTTKEILCDEKGNPIIVVRAGTSDYQGIHFIVVERSGLDTNKSYTHSDGTTYTSTLNEYFAAETPLSVSGSGYSINENAPTFTDASGNTVVKQTYINNVVSSYEDYQSRAETLRNTIRDFDSAYDQRVYTWLKETTALASNITVTFGGEETSDSVNVSTKVDNYVQMQIEQTDAGYAIEDSTWEEYVEYLTNQTELRTTKLIPITCAVNFARGYGDENSELYKVCHYES